MDATIQSDVTLLQRYATAGDAAAMGELISRYAGMVFGVARRITGDAQDAEDVAQSCFLELLRNAAALPQARSSESAAGWIHATVVHRALDSIRNETTRRRHERQAGRLRRESAESTQWWDQLAPQVDAAIDALPESLKAPLILHFLQGKTQPQIALDLGISQPTVSRRLEQAVAALRRRLRGAELAGACAALPLLMQEHAVTQAPASLTASLGKMAVAGVGTANLKIPAAASRHVSALHWLTGAHAAWALAVCAVLSAAIWWSATHFGGAAPKQVVISSPSQAPALEDPRNQDAEGILLPTALSLHVSDPVGASAWYRDHLGFSIDPSQTAEMAIVRRDQCRIKLQRQSTAATTATISVEEKENIDELRREFTTRGTPILAGPTLDGQRYHFSVKDDDGNVLSFVFSK